VKLSTLHDGGRDGRLIVVSRDGERAAPADDIAPTLQAALEDWPRLEPALRARAKALDENRVPRIFEVDPHELSAPLPRAYEWLDGSAYLSHVILVRRARGAEPPATLRTDPLMYQGGGGRFLGPREDIAHFSEDFGIDFESELAVITDEVPMGTTAIGAAAHVRLLMLVNDVTLRQLVPAELDKGFGFLVSKPATAFSPFAVTPDELGPAWRDGRVHGRLRTLYNDTLFGDPEAGPEMHFSFFDLIAHACRTRSLCAGTIIGSGTVSNADATRGASCLAEKRMREKIETGTMTTSFMRFGDRVAIDMLDDSGVSIFGRIEQRVVKAEAAP
jgi:fumarylacetoacetate (FAA) hydrolase